MDTKGITTSPNRDETSSIEVTRELVMKFLDCHAEGVLLSEQDKERFILTAISCQLNPFKREIHHRFSHENGTTKTQIITGYEVYLRKADQTGVLDGWKAWIEGSGEDMKALVEIHRKDWEHPFIHEVYLKEAAQKNSDSHTTDFWERMPRFQLKKVAISQGFRLCFASDIGGMPYEAAELPEVQSTTPESKPEIPQSSVAGLVEAIHKLTKDNSGILTYPHVEWIENQLKQQKTEAQLRGLMKHVQEAIETGDANSKKTFKSGTRKEYPPVIRRPRIPVDRITTERKQTIPAF